MAKWVGVAVAQGTWALALGVLAQACIPTLEDDLSRVTSSRVLAIVAEPPEVGEGDVVRLSALVAGVAEAPEPSVSFAFCRARKPLSELGPVDPVCLGASDPTALQALGTAESLTANVDRAACSAFGPRRPSAEPGAPAGRAVDPDPTGGFYQPVIASLTGGPAVLGAVRLDCGLAGADRAQVIEYNQRHRPNQNPAIQRLELSLGGTWTELLPREEPAATPLSVAAGTELAVRVAFAGCEPDSACTGAETYVVFDAESRLLVDRSEDLFASWYASAGAFDEYRTAPVLAAETSAENRWIAPAQPGSVDLWVVLRDGRGGVGWSSYRVQVE
jgi:hypothetical protein